MTLIRMEMIIGGLFTGAIIGFFWPPAASVPAMLMLAFAPLAFRN